MKTIRAAAIILLATGCSDGPAAPPFPDPDGGSWATWVLPAGDVLRPGAPPAAGSQAEQTERTEIMARQSALTTADQAAIARWSGPPSLAWNAVASQRLSFYWAILPDVRVATPARAARTLALLHVALYDAQVAVWEAKQAYQRTPPFMADAGIQRHARWDGAPSYPSEHAAAAAAAALILAYAIPNDDPASFEALASEAADSRVAAGLAWPSDVAAGLAIGREVAARVIARAETDGASQVWTGSVPTGPGMWLPTPPRNVAVPFDPLAGTWRGWLLPSGASYRPAPHPAPGSAAFVADLNELRQLNTTRTTAQADQARFWATDPPPNRWNDMVTEEATRRGLSSLRTARAFALVNVAMADAFIACWDAKFHYWLYRPVTADPAITTVFATPPFPSYPSGHSTVSAAAAEVMVELFPDRTATWQARAHEASESRVWGGVHYRFDITVGEELGAKVGALAVQRARQDGS